MSTLSNKEAKNLVKKIFGKNAEKYVTSKSHSQGTDLPLIVEWLEPDPNALVLDIATGGGHVAKTLAPHVATVFATDLTKEMLENTANHLRTQYPNIFYVLADAESLPFMDESFDIVTCRIAPHHFPNPDDFIREVSRVLKRDGKFILIDNIAPEDTKKGAFMNEVEKSRDISHVRCLSMSEWQKLLQSNALEEVQSRERKKKFIFPEWVKVTTKSQEQRDEVEKLLLNASEEIKEYFSIEIADGKVQSHQIDEWMVLCNKE